MKKRTPTILALLLTTVAALLAWGIPGYPVSANSFAKGGVVAVFNAQQRDEWMYNPMLVSGELLFSGSFDHSNLIVSSVMYAKTEVCFECENDGLVPVISGLSIDRHARPLAHVLISSADGLDAWTDEAGLYRLTTPNSGDYSVVSSKVGYTFSPASPSVSVPPDANGRNFTTSIPYVAGRVVDQDGQPMPDVLISNGSTYSATTDATGYYTVTQVMPGDHVFYPSRIGYTFEPASHSVSVPPDANGRNFTGTFSSLLIHLPYVVLDKKLSQ